MKAGETYIISCTWPPKDHKYADETGVKRMPGQYLTFES